MTSVVLRWKGKHQFGAAGIAGEPQGKGALQRGPGGGAPQMTIFPQMKNLRFDQCELLGGEARDKAFRHCQPQG